MEMKVTEEGFPYRQRRYLLVDLDHERFTFVPLKAEEGRNLLGGRLLSMMLWDRYALPERISGSLYDEGNPIVVALGALSDIDLHVADGYVVTTRSPVTKAVECFHGNGSFASALVCLGVSAIVLIGREQRTAMVAIDEERVSFSIEEGLHDQRCHGISTAIPDWHHLVIGPAAEHGCPYSSIICDGENVGRHGLGLVFAAKNLKVVLIRGTWHERVSYDAQDLGEAVSSWKGRKPESLMEAARGLGWIAIDGFSRYGDGRLWALQDGDSRWIARLAMGPNLDIYGRKPVDTLLSLCDDIGLDPISSSLALRASGADKEAYPDILETFAKGQGRWSPLMDKDALAHYSAGSRPLLPFELRVLPCMAALTACGDDTVVYRELYGQTLRMAERDDNFALSRIMLHAVVERALAETLGLSHFFCRVMEEGDDYSLLGRLTTDCEGHLCSSQWIEERGLAVLSWQDKLDHKLKVTRSCRLPDFFSTDVLDGDAKERVVRSARLVETYQALRGAMARP